LKGFHILPLRAFALESDFKNKVLFIVPKNNKGTNENE
jgi:hypothetical protein